MKHRSEGATAFLGTPGFLVGAQLEVDEIWLHVDTKLVGCRSCVTRRSATLGARVNVRDLAIAGREVVLVWAKPHVTLMSRWTGLRGSGHQDLGPMRRE